MHYQVKPSILSGRLTLPPSKSHTLRAILFASLAHGKSIINHYLDSPDTDAMIAACRQIGGLIEVNPNELIITGVAGKPHTASDVINAGNSGQVLRFIAAIAALTDGYTVITGDESVRNNRPIAPLLSALNQLDVFAVSARMNGYAPVIIKGPHLGGRATLNGADSQPVSGLLIASAFAKHPTTLKVEEPGETPWIELTLDWFKRLNIPYTRRGYTDYQLEGNAYYPGFNYSVPGDFSACAFPVVAALLTQSELIIEHADMADIQGDKALLAVLIEMGAKIDIVTEKKELHIMPCEKLKGKVINVNHFIDAVPILAVLGCYTENEIILTDAGIARHKECDRLSAITKELRLMGANIAEEPDGLVIHPQPLRGANVQSHKDHRIAMALTVAGLKASGTTNIMQTECVAKSYPDFVSTFKKIGAHLTEHK